MTTNLFEQANLFTMHEEQQRVEKDKILAVRILRQLWMEEGIDKGMTLGEYVDSIVTPEDEIANQILEYATRKEELHTKAREEFIKGIHTLAEEKGISQQEAFKIIQEKFNKDEREQSKPTTSPVQEGAKALLRLQAIQHGCVFII